MDEFFTTACAVRPQSLMTGFVTVGRDLVDFGKHSLAKRSMCVCPAIATMPLSRPRAALFVYDRWANRKLFDASRKLTAEQYVVHPVPGWSSVRSTMRSATLRRFRDRPRVECPIEGAHRN